MTSEICKFKVGDLVRYRPPEMWRRSSDPTFGIVIRTSAQRRPAGCAYDVRWSNGKQTTEWENYLGEVEDGN